MKVITCNVNGIRSAAKKGFWEWLESQDADFICLQEVRAQLDQIPSLPVKLQKYHCYHSFATKPGYSGVMILSKVKPDKVFENIGLSEMDDEGRYVQVDVGNISVASIYFPSGSAKDSRQSVKYEFMDFFMNKFRPLVNDKQKFILCGDYNIAHKKIDIKNWKSNEKNSGFLPEERAWMDVLFDEVGFVDAFRVLNQNVDEYSWWSNRGNAYANNVGWRIDYQVVSPALKPLIVNTSIYRNERFSDHAPVVVEYKV